MMRSLLVSLPICSFFFIESVVGQVVASAYGDGAYSSGTFPSQGGYDCAGGYSNWRGGWDSGKKAWCCRHRGLGCADVTYPSTYPGAFPSAYTDVHPDNYLDHRDVNPSNYPIQRGSAYNCQRGYTNWKFGWSSRKKQSCCQSAGLGCPEVSYPNTYPGAFPPAYRTVYPEQYRRRHHVHIAPYTSAGGYHHHHHDLAVHRDPYDCVAGHSDWRRAWSVSKKAWCCDNHHRGCTHHHSHNVAVVADRRQYYHNHHNHRDHPMYNHGDGYYNKVEMRSDGEVVPARDRGLTHAVAFCVVASVSAAIAAFAVRSLRSSAKHPTQVLLTTEAHAVEEPSSEEQGSCSGLLTA